jgi:hypothetical protein
LSGGVRLPALVWTGSESLVVTLPDGLDAETSAFAKFARRSFPADPLRALQERSRGDVRPSEFDSLPQRLERDWGELPGGPIPEDCRSNRHSRVLPRRILRDLTKISMLRFAYPQGLRQIGRVTI